MQRFCIWEYSLSLHDAVERIRSVVTGPI